MFAVYLDLLVLLALEVSEERKVPLVSRDPLALVVALVTRVHLAQL